MSYGNNSQFWLLEVDPPIFWKGDSRFIDIYGPDSALCHPFGPTRRALLLALAGDPFPGRTPRERYKKARGWQPAWTNLDQDWSTPVYPVNDDTRSVRTAHTSESLGMKVSLYRGDDPYPYP